MTARARPGAGPAAGGGPAPPRLVPEAPLPSYAYVTGRSPHPQRDPGGHRFGADAPRPAAPDPADWRASRAYLLGLDLFNHGYYWEAHEAWEDLWHACGRAGPLAAFLQGLIALAAAGVKARQGQPRGVREHARRARRLFREADPAAAADGRCLGLDLDALARLAERVAARPPRAGGAGAGPEIVFGVALVPADPPDADAQG